MNVTNNRTLRKIIVASSVGTLIEWYDFYIFGSLATLIALKFFPADQGSAALLSTLAIFAAGFIVRPFGALVFGRMGDRAGRKYTFLLTLVLMGGSTFAIGLVPSYESIGFAAPVLVLLLRLVQGLALGGEYGGAATYVAEHSPVGKRGFYTSWIQTTATLGLFLSLGVILITRHLTGPEAFSTWGWRIPFLLSAVLVAVSIYIRLKMEESPLFEKVKKEGNISKNPLKESFTKKENLKMVLLALFGAVMGQGVVWYTGQFYAQSFIENTCKVDFEQSRTILLWSILLATPFFIVFGKLSDTYGRKWIMLAGMLAGVLFYRPIYSQILKLTDVNNKPVPALTSTDKESVKDSNGNFIRTTVNTYYYTDHKLSLKSIETDTLYKGQIEYTLPLIKQEKLLDTEVYLKLIFLVFVQIIFVTMVYGPIAAFLVELFPTRIRYTSMSLPYHIGNGVFGGLVPFISTLIIVYSQTEKNPAGEPLAGLWYPVIVAAVCFIIGLLFLDNKKTVEHE